jgi:heme/copper-type cytochrome/quinol oxidase subunit 2
MENIQWNLLLCLFVAWGVITAVLLVLILYRRALSVREDDQLFLGAREEGVAAEQRAMFQKISRTTAPIVTLAVLSGLLLIASVGLWLYQGYKSF